MLFGFLQNFIRQKFFSFAKCGEIACCLSTRVYSPKKLKPLSEYCFCIHWKLKVLVMKYLCDISWSLPVGQPVVLSFLCLLSHLFTNRYSITTIRMGGRFLPVVISLANYFSIVIILHFLILVWSNSILRWYGQTHLLFEPNNCNFIIHDFYIMSYVTLLYW